MLLLLLSFPTASSFDLKIKKKMLSKILPGTHLA